MTTPAHCVRLSMTVLTWFRVVRVYADTMSPLRTQSQNLAISFEPLQYLKGPGGRFREGTPIKGKVQGGYSHEG